MKVASFFLYTVLMLFSDAISAQLKAPILKKWKVAAELPGDTKQNVSLGLAGPVAGIHNNVLIIAGGSNFPDRMPWQGGKKTYYDDVYVYIKKGQQIILKKNKYKLALNIAYAANCSMPHGIVYAGGENGNGISNKVFLLQWDKKKSVLVTKKLPDLPIKVTNAAITSNSSIIYLAGGETVDGVSDKFYSLDIEDTITGWRELPALPKPVSHSVILTLKKNNQPFLYMIGGRKRNANDISDFYSNVFEFDIHRNLWKEKESLPYNVSAASGVVTDDSKLLIFGGDKGETFHKVETLIAAINTEKDEMKKQGLLRQKNEVLFSHPGFSKNVLLYNSVNDKWEVIDAIPFDAPVTTTAVLSGSHIIIPAGETRAGIRTPKILMVKIRRH